MKLPTNIDSGFWKEGHVQGIAVDLEKQHIYFSFTTILLKTDFEGRPLGSVRNLAGHLGCITMDPKRRRIYGSLEMKHDIIGKEIIDRIGWNPSQEDNFYQVCFEIDKIDRMGMDAEKDGIMRAVWLREVAEEFKAMDPVSGKEHHYGCSGIDATGLGPAFGEGADSREKLMVCYGIYNQTGRTDNDHQVILQYDPEIFDVYGQPLDQANPHHSGPEAAENRYFLYTGNTRWGVQNLEYDPASRLWLFCVYDGRKESFTNFHMFLVDGTVRAVEGELIGREGEKGLLLVPAKLGEEGQHGIWGNFFPLGSTGVASLGDGRFYFSRPVSNEEEKTYSSKVGLYRMDRNCKQVFVACE